MAVSVYTREWVGTGSVQGSTAGRRDTEDTGKHHTSCGGTTDSCVVSRAAGDQCEVVLLQEVEEQALESK